MSTIQNNKHFQVKKKKKDPVPDDMDLIKYSLPPDLVPHLYHYNKKITKKLFSTFKYYRLSTTI